MDMSTVAVLVWVIVALFKPQIRNTILIMVAMFILPAPPPIILLPLGLQNIPPTAIQKMFSVGYYAIIGYNVYHFLKSEAEEIKSDLG